MLRRSLILFTLLVLAGLALTAGYALLGLHGPDDTLAEAEALYARGDSNAAVTILDQIDHSVSRQGDLELQIRLWWLRFQAHDRLGNSRRALDDIENLLRERDRLADPARIDLLLKRRIRFLALLGQGDLARQHAIDFLADNPNDAYGHELAGEACQRAYQQAQIDLSKRLQSELGLEREKAGLAAFLEYLYRPEGDPDVAFSLRNLEDLYCHEPRFRQVWRPLAADLRRLREQVQEALRFHQQSLELAAIYHNGGLEIAAYRGVSLALEQADRIDDLVAQAEIYLAGYDHHYTIEAATDAAKAHYDADLYEATVALCDRYLPRGSVTARVAAGKLRNSVEDLLQLKAFSLYELGRPQELAQLAAEVEQMKKAGLELPLPGPTASGLFGVLTDREAHTEAQLRSVTNAYFSPRRPAPLTGKDPLDLLTPLLLDQMRKRGAPSAELMTIARAWSSARPAASLPRHEQARIQLEQSQPTAAMATASAILEQQPGDEVALRLLADAANASYQGSGQDGNGLLQQCITRQQLRPESVPHPICLLLTGEAALSAKNPRIARECARAASNAFPWARWPRHLAAQAELQAGRPAEAVTLLTAAIENDPQDGQAIELWFQACQRAGQPSGRFLSRVIRTGLDTVGTAKELLRAALQEDSPLTGALARRALRRGDADAELLALCAQALAIEGLPEAAAEQLERAYVLHETATAVAPRVAATPQVLTVASIQVLAARAPRTPDEELLRLAEKELERMRPAGVEAGTALVATARQLEASGHVRTAFWLASTALRLGDAIEIRTAESFLLAGRLALALGDLELAAAHWTAALTFPGGGAAGEALARLELRLGQRDRLELAFTSADDPDDPALALLAGATGTAVQVAQQRVRKDPSDLLAGIALAFLAEVSPDAIGAELRGLESSRRLEIIELLALMGERRYSDVTLPRAGAIVEALPDSVTAHLLLARCLADHGDGAEAAAIHATLHRLGVRLPALPGEMVRAAMTPGYVFPAEARDELRARLATAPAELPAALAAFTMRDLAAEAAVQGNLAVAGQLLADLWVRYPAASGVNVFDTERLFGTGRPAEAMAILAQLRTVGDPESRLAAATAMFLAGIEREDQLRPVTLRALRDEALKALEAGDLLGPPLEFLIHDPTRLEGLADARLHDYVGQLIERAATSRESWKFAERALRFARENFTPEALLTIVDAAVELHPALAPLWVERARLLATMRRGREGLADARALLVFADTPALILDFLALAAEQRNLTAADLQRLEQLPAELLESPHGQYVQGIVALRRGRADEAERRLADAAPQRSGFHVYARALANLERRTADSRALAHELLAELLRDYASSSLARNAGSFARQLESN